MNDFPFSHFPITGLDSNSPTFFEWIAYANSPEFIKKLNDSISNNTDQFIIDPPCEAHRVEPKEPQQHKARC